MKLPQLSLRDLFWLVLVCALAVGWWLDRSRLSKEWRFSSSLYHDAIFKRSLLIDALEGEECIKVVDGEVYVHGDHIEGPIGTQKKP